MIPLLSFLAFWLACGFVAAGWSFANASHDYHSTAPEWVPTDRRLSWFVAALVCLCFVLLLVNGEHRHGWRKWW